MKKRPGIHMTGTASKAGRRAVAVLLTCTLVFGLGACGAQKTTGDTESIKPVTVKHEQEPPALQTANEAAAIALRQYIHARVATEAFLTADPAEMTMAELSAMGEDLLRSWENAERFSSVAENLTNQACQQLEADAAKQSSVLLQDGTAFIAPDAFNFTAVSYAEESGRKIDPQTWAENLTKQYDALQGAKRYQQLAQQLGTDTKNAYEQMVLAQKIIRNAAELEEAQGVADTWTESINYLQGVKTASKVGVFVVGTVITGGGSISALGASSWSAGQAGAVIVGGTDCIVDIGATGSSIILGENSQVAVGFNDIKDKLAPVSAVVGLGTFNAGETGEQLAYIGDTLVDWFYEGKVMGVKVDKRDVTARIFDSVGVESVKSALEAAGYVFPGTSRTLTEIMSGMEKDPAAAVARLNDLVSKMAELAQAAGITPGTDDSSGMMAAVLGDPSIFGKYTCVIDYTGADSETQTITLKDGGDDTLIWIDGEGDETLLPYKKGSSTLHWEGGEFTLHVEFSGFGSQVSGSGYMNGIIWEQPFDAKLKLSKISD